MPMFDREEHFRCACHSPEHTIVFDVDKDEMSDYDPFPEMYLHVHLHQHRSIFKRIWVAIKYVFGYKCKYGHWDCWVLRSEDAERMRDMLDEFIAAEETAKVKRKTRQSTK